MTRALLGRVGRLESRIRATECRFRVRFVRWKRLAPDYKGERHVITHDLPKQGDQEWVEYEEVPGPEVPQPPARRGDHVVETCLDIEFVGSPRSQAAAP